MRKNIFVINRYTHNDTSIYPYIYIIPLPLNECKNLKERSKKEKND